MGIFTLAINGTSSQDSSIQKFTPSGNSTITRSSTDEIPRTSPIELEIVYGKDPIGFNIVNTLTDMIMAGMPKLENLFNSDKKSIKTYYETFFENIGEVGENITTEDLFENIFKSEFTFGNAFVQIIFDNKKKKIQDLSLIDPKRIDYLKDSSKRVVLDENNMPVGYTIKKDFGDLTMGDTIPKEYVRGNLNIKDSYFLFAERIVHFKINTIGDRFWGIGVIEPSYKSTIRKINIEEGQANSIYKNGFNPLIGYVGSDRKVATPKDLEWVGGLLSNLDVTKVGTFPDWVKIETLKYDQSDIVSGTLGYMRENQISPAGLPMAIASGKADTTNRSTLGIHLQLIQFKLNAIVKKTLSTFEKRILKKIAYYNKVADYPSINWGQVGPTDKEKIVDYLLNSVSSGVLTAEDVRPKLISELGLK